MKEKMFLRDDLCIAAVRYLDKEKGVELGDNLSYVFLLKGAYGDEDRYFNPFDITESYPTFKRSLYTNYIDDEAYGTKLVPCTSWFESGPCWVIEEELSKQIFDDVVTSKELEDYMLATDRYFKDRMKVAKTRIKSSPLKMMKIIKEDKKRKEYMDYYFMERETEKVKKR